MKRIVALLLSLLFALSLCACNPTPAMAPTTEPTVTTAPDTTVDPTEDTTIGFVPSPEATWPTETEPSVPYTSEELQENLGIAIAAAYTDTAFELEVSWVNNTGSNREFGHLFGITVLQNGTPLTLATSTDTVNTTVPPDDSTTMVLQYTLTDLSPVTVELRYSEPNTPGILWTFTYDLAAAG